MVQAQILHMEHIKIAEIVKADIKTCLVTNIMSLRLSDTHRKQDLCCK
jgi:hypothetical protein